MSDGTLIVSPVIYHQAKKYLPGHVFKELFDIEVDHLGTNHVLNVTAFKSNTSGYYAEQLTAKYKLFRIITTSNLIYLTILAAAICMVTNSPVSFVMTCIIATVIINVDADRKVRKTQKHAIASGIISDCAKLSSSTQHLGEQHGPCTRRSE